MTCPKLPTLRKSVNAPKPNASSTYTKYNGIMHKQWRSKGSLYRWSRACDAWGLPIILTYMPMSHAISRIHDSHGHISRHVLCLPNYFNCSTTPFLRALIKKFSSRNLEHRTSALCGPQLGPALDRALSYLHLQSSVQDGVGLVAERLWTCLWSENENHD